MTATLKGGGLDLQRFIADAAAGLAPNVARGALRAGAVVIADMAEAGCRSKEVAATIGVSTRVEPGGVVVAKVQTKGDGAYKAPWLEHGTDPHYISVDPEQGGGRTAGRVNRLAKQGVLVINGEPVGTTVFHPGAKPYPFMRPAVDNGEQEAIGAISGYIATKLTKDGVKDAPAIGGNDE